MQDLAFYLKYNPNSMQYPQVNVTKDYYFEYILNKLLSWKNELSYSPESNDFSLLKSLKLLFFVVSAKSEKNKDYPLLDDVFENFYAMPFGHVETDIYTLIKTKQLTYFEINDFCAKRTSDFTIQEDDITNCIDSSIEYLKDQNRNLVLLTAFDLVNLSHTWYSWKRTYNEALKEGKKSKKIPVDRIKNEDKIFSLDIF